LYNKSYPSAFLPAFLSVASLSPVASKHLNDFYEDAACSDFLIQQLGTAIFREVFVIP